MDGWNLQRLGVHPDFQSHGVGAIIVNHLIHVVSYCINAHPLFPNTVSRLGFPRSLEILKAYLLRD